MSFAETLAKHGITLRNYQKSLEVEDKERWASNQYNYVPSSTKKMSENIGNEKLSLYTKCFTEPGTIVV
jgi:hypothetical protein